MYERTKNDNKKRQCPNNILSSTLLCETSPKTNAQAIHGFKATDNLLEMLSLGVVHANFEHGVAGIRLFMDYKLCTVYCTSLLPLSGTLKPETAAFLDADIWTSVVGLLKKGIVSLLYSCVVVLWMWISCN